jgi:chromate transporter
MIRRRRIARTESVEAVARPADHVEEPAESAGEARGVAGRGNVDPARTPSAAAANPPGTLELFRTFLGVGASAFGMAIMQTVRSTPVKRGWLSPEEVDEGFGVVQLYPGAMMTDLVAFIGYRLRRVPGAQAATLGFLSPSLGLVLVLSWAYFAFGARPGVRDLVVGLDGLVVGVLASVTLDFGVQHVRGKLAAVLALGAFAVGVAGVNVLWAVLGAFTVGAVALRGKGGMHPCEVLASSGCRGGAW